MSRFCKFGKLHVTKGNVDKLLGILLTASKELKRSLADGSANVARKEGKKAKGAGARALASVAVTLRVTTTPAALNAPLQGASHSPFRLRNCWEGRSVRASSLLRQLAKGGCAARRLSWVTPGFSQSRRCKTTASERA